MRVFVESLRRLYRAGKVSPEKVLGYYNDGKLSPAEYSYVIG